MSIEAMKLALDWIKDATVVLSHTSSAIQGGIGAEAEGVGGCSVAVEDALRQAIEQAQKQDQTSCYCQNCEALSKQLEQYKKEPVEKPYAYEYGRDNGDGTYSVVIEKGELVQTAPAVYNYVRPRNPHKDWPVKELFDNAPPQRQPLTDEQRIQMWHKAKPAHLSWASFDWYSQGIADAEAAHGITGEQK